MERCDLQSCEVRHVIITRLPRWRRVLFPVPTAGTNAPFIRICSCWPAGADEPVFGDRAPPLAVRFADDDLPEGAAGDGHQFLVQAATTASQQALADTFLSKPRFCILCDAPTTYMVATSSLVPPWPFDIFLDVFPVCKVCELAVSRRSHARIGRMSEAAFGAPVGAACTGCGAHTKDRTTFQMCSRCKIAYFCSSDCFRREWLEHRKVCLPPAKPAGDG